MLDSLQVLKQARNITDVYRECDNIQLYVNNANTVQTIQSIRSNPHQDWIFYASIGSLLLIMLIRLYYDQNLRDFLRSVFNENIAYQQFAYAESRTFIYNLLLDLIYLLNIALFIISLLKWYKVKLPYPDSFNLLLIIALIFLLIQVKFFLSKAFAGIFKLGEKADYYAFSITKILRFIGLILIPFVLIVYLSNFAEKQYLYMIFGIFMTMILLYGYFQFLNRNAAYIQNHFFHFFVYFCTFEIVPVLVISKLVYEYIL